MRIFIYGHYVEAINECMNLVILYFSFHLSLDIFRVFEPSQHTIAATGENDWKIV